MIIFLFERIVFFCNIGKCDLSKSYGSIHSF
jgi:hypothetical protein